jgi:23S rRNA (cytosine1962-C5)-methyltransferase|tara:strand:- start:6518 stop:7426 length:909 start_codon:yes stop_codon:yes gene_type:complete
MESIHRALASSCNDARRFFHGRGGILPDWKHIAVDWYAPAVFLTLYEEKASSEQFINELDTWAKKDDRVTCLAVQRRYLVGSPVEVLWGDLPDRAHEADLQFVLSLDKNQNHGFFPDMQPGRQWLRERSEGKRVLNLFSYTCALSVAAMAGGAESVVNLDLSSRALAVGRDNHRLNFDQKKCRRVTYLPHDLFKSWGRLKRLAPFDLVVLDPPSHQPGSFVAAKDYPRMLRRLGEILNPDGAEVLACLNAPELDECFLTDLFQEHLGGAEFVGRLTEPEGYHEAGEGWGLKRLVYQVKAEKS